MQTYALPDLFEELERLMPQIGIRSCFIVRFDRSGADTDPREVPGRSELLFAYAGGVRHPLPDTALFPTGNILPEPFLTYPNRVTDVVKPLFFRDEQYGYVIFEAQDDETVHLEELRGQISDSLMYALMMSRQKQVETDLARTVDALRESNRIREVAATVDALTGLLNRQGFIEKMARILLSKQTEGLTGRLLYFDIDRLKEINQRFGYPAGDRAIQASAALLRGIFPPDALIGRFCGDEFAVLLHEANNSRVEDYRKRVESGALSFSSDSGLTLRMYVGYSDVKFGEDMDAETVIRKADADLYDHKRQAGEESDR
jgi:diguanylate cyclase (GGDEF)-like protein